MMVSIVVGPTSSLQSIQRYDFAVVRYNPDGSLDDTFDGDLEMDDPGINGFLIQAMARLPLTSMSEMTKPMALRCNMMAKLSLWDKR